MPRRSTGFPAADASEDFTRARRAQVIRRVLGRHQPPLPFDDVLNAMGPTRRRDVGLRTIPLDHVVGSVDRTRDFDRAFRPATGRQRQRWERVAEAMRRDQALPPIDVYRVGDEYYVRDGHHRVSVARALGRDTIDANVVEIRPATQ
jgi:uncharacterized ParB-like nuclease family protein